MRIYNTLTRQLDVITPLQPGQIGVYTCGPTVYDYSHIGHWYNYVRMDTLIRALQADGLQTTWVMNITDVGHLVSDGDDGEDKLEKGARREGKTAWEVAEFYAADFMASLEILHILTPNFVVKATDHIAEQIELIQRLDAKGFTYVIDDGVYYDTGKFVAYAAFAGLDLDEQQAGARVNFNSQKRNLADFALWKFSPVDSQRDMEWDSPWGKGFPGWHIECSAMSMKYLGESFDIHTGGIDHVPVHHTNEIAQSEAATGKRLAQYWLHSNHVTVNGEKISKSLGNGIRLQEILDKGIAAEAVRLNILESHYRSQSKFSWESLTAAANRLQHWRAVASLAWQPQDILPTGIHKRIVDAHDNIANALGNDLDTPLILSLIDDTFSAVEKTLLSESEIAAFKSLLIYIDNITGIDLLQNNGPIDAAVIELIVARETSRLNKDWPKSDQQRDHLAQLGYGIKDLPSGTTQWFRL